MININYAVLSLGSLLRDLQNDKDIDQGIISNLNDLITNLSGYLSRDNSNKSQRMQSLVEADQLTRVLLLRLKKQASTANPINKLFSEISSKLKKNARNKHVVLLEELLEYCDSRFEKHQKVNKILSSISMKEILLANLRAKKDYGPQEDLGLGHEPYIPSSPESLKIKRQRLIQNKYGKVVKGLDDRRVLDGRGLAPTLRHHIEKYDLLHRPWRNFLYREYNDTFDFWKNAKNVELHLIYPDPADKPEELYNEIVKKWIAKMHTYTKDLMIIYDKSSEKWKAFIRDEKSEDKYSEVIIDSKSPLMTELKKVNEKNCRDYDRRVLENIIVQTQVFAINKKPKDAYYFYRDNTNFYSWVQNNTKLKTTGTVVYLNELERTNYLVRSNEQGQLIYLQSGEIITTKEDTSRKPENYIYTLDLNGNLYIAKEGTYNGDPNVRIQHPSFTSGARLLAAGTIKVKDGKITYIDNGSGHYMPGEFSLMKAVLEFKKNNLLADNCMVDFLTMNRNDSRYASEKNNLNTVERFLDVSSKALLAVVSHDEKLKNKEEVKSSSHSKSEEEFPDFDSVWNNTDLSKILLCLDKQTSASCDFFFDSINRYIGLIGKEAAEKKDASAANNYHAIRYLWQEMLNKILMGATNQGEIPSKYVLEILGGYLPQVKKTNGQENFAALLASMIQNITESKNVNCVFSKERVIHELTAYNLQLKVASSKKLHKDNGEEEIKKLSNYKLFLLTTKIKDDTHLTPTELDKVESENLIGISR